MSTIGRRNKRNAAKPKFELVLCFTCELQAFDLDHISVGRSNTKAKCDLMICMFGSVCNDEP